MDPEMWLSFVKEGKFQGVVITRAKNIEQAIEKCWKMGINPGGDVAGSFLPEGYIPDYPRDQILSEEFLRAKGLRPRGEQENAY